MKRITVILTCCMALAATAAEKIEQSGVPAVIEAANGRKARVFLQELKDDRLTFQPYQVPRNRTVPVEAVSSLAFYPTDFDAEALQQMIDRAEYDQAVAVLAPLMASYEKYMLIENNFRDQYSRMMECYFWTGDYEKAKEAADIMIATGVPLLTQRGQVFYALIAVETGDLETAARIREEIEGAAAGLYVQASIERAEKRIREAFKTISNILLFHANDVEWMGRGELLSAQLYLDYMGTNAVITTNSPMLTARQTMNIYRGASVSAEAEKIWKSLDGETAQKEIDARKEQRRKELAELKAREEEEERQAELKAAEDAETAARAAGGTNTAAEAQSEIQADGTGTNVTDEVQSDIADESM